MTRNFTDQDGTPWLEPGAGIAAQQATTVPDRQLALAIQLSAAITLKRLVDMLEPLAIELQRQAEAERRP